MEITNFNPDVRSFGSVERREIKLANGYVLIFRDVFDFDTEPIITLDVYYPCYVPIGYMCVIDVEYLRSIRWNRESDEVEVVGNAGKTVTVAIENDSVLIKNN